MATPVNSKTTSVTLSLNTQYVQDLLSLLAALKFPIRIDSKIEREDVIDDLGNLVPTKEQQLKLWEQRQEAVQSSLLKLVKMEPTTDLSEEELINLINSAAEEARLEAA